MNKPFTVEILRDLITQYDCEEISLSRFKGILNEIAAKHYGWVKCEDRLPTKEDADDNEYVLCMGTHPFVAKWDDSIMFELSTHWRKIGNRPCF